MKLLQTNIMINCPESYMHFICSLFSDLIYTETSGDREGRTVSELLLKCGCKPRLKLILTFMWHTSSLLSTEQWMVAF